MKLYVVSRHGRMSLIGLIVGNKLINKEAFKYTMLWIWKPSGEIHFKYVGDNLLFIEFTNDQDLEKVKQGRLWTFDRSLINSKEYYGMIAPKDIVFEEEPMWIQLHNFPLGGMTKEFGGKIGSMVGEVLVVDVDKEGIGWGPYLRVQVQHH